MFLPLSNGIASNVILRNPDILGMTKNLGDRWENNLYPDILRGVYTERSEYAQDDTDILLIKRSLTIHHKS